jgi:hypothetical protein
LACNCIGGNPCPCQRGSIPVGRIELAPLESPFVAKLQFLLEAAEKQREEAVKAMQAVQPGVLSAKDEERLQRRRAYAYQLQNRLDNRPARFNMDYTRARLSAICWAVTKISGVPFDPSGAAPSTGKAQ